MRVLTRDVVARVAKAMGMDVIAYTASPRKTPESKRDEGFIVPGTGDPDGSLPSAWYSGTAKEDLHNFLKQEIDLLVIGVPLTYVPSLLHRYPPPQMLCLTNSHPPQQVHNPPPLGRRIRPPPRQQPARHVHRQHRPRRHHRPTRPHHRPKDKPDPRRRPRRHGPGAAS